MAGYSATPLAKKLGIKRGQRLAFPGAPAGFSRMLGELPEAVQVKARAAGPLDVIVFFTTSKRDLVRQRDLALLTANHRRTAARGGCER